MNVWMVFLLANRGNEEKRGKNKDQGKNGALRHTHRWRKRQQPLLVRLSSSFKINSPIFWLKLCPRQT